MHAGQAVVQFAKQPVSEQEFAMKFFLSASAFRAECAQYTDKSTPLWRFLPQLQVIAQFYSIRLACRRFDSAQVMSCSIHCGTPSNQFVGC